MDVNKLVYLAYPIDLADHVVRSQVQSEVQAVVNALSNADDPIYVFEPGRAFRVNQHCEPDPRMQAINNAALARADVVACIFPENARTVGVPYEMALANSMGIPVLVYRQGVSWALMQPGIHLFDSLERFTAAIQLVGLRARTSVPKATWEALTPDAAAPTRAYDGDAGFDLAYSGSGPLFIEPGECVDVPCHVAIEWPPNTWGLLVGRSSTFRSRGLIVNMGIIDAGYRGPLYAITRNMTEDAQKIDPGDRIAQIIPMPLLAAKIAMEQGTLSESDRGTNGFGSSGR